LISKNICRQDLNLSEPSRLKRHREIKTPQQLLTKQKIGKAENKEESAIGDGIGI
jgi:hypothetical protein